MDGIRDQDVVTALRRQMTIAAARQVASAGNLANSETPGYEAVEPTFDDALTGRLGDPAALSVSHRPVEGLPARRDGNTVQIDRELLTMGRAAGDFAAAQTALAAKFRLVRYAINEGR